MFTNSPSNPTELQRFCKEECAKKNVCRCSQLVEANLKRLAAGTSGFTKYLFGGGGEYKFVYKCMPHISDLYLYFFNHTLLSLHSQFCTVMLVCHIQFHKVAY